MPPGKPRGVILTMHGGAWSVTDGPGALRVSEALKRRMCSRGLVTYNCDYRAGGPGLAGLERMYDLIKRRRPLLPIGAAGESSGGHLAMMLARRRALSGVIAMAAPADLTTVTGGVRVAAEAHFGAANLDIWSPAIVGMKGTPTLASYTTGDTEVRPSQGARLGRQPGVRAITLRSLAGGPGTSPRAGHPFVHTSVSTAEWHRYTRVEMAFVNRVFGRREPVG